MRIPKPRPILLASSMAIGLAATVPATSAEEWDMPMAYADSNYHSQNGKPVRRSGWHLYRRRIDHYRPCGRVALQGQRDQAGSADRPGQDWRASAIRAPEREPALRNRFGSVPCHILCRKRQTLALGQGHAGGIARQRRPRTSLFGSLAAPGESTSIATSIRSPTWMVSSSVPTMLPPPVSLN